MRTTIDIDAALLKKLRAEARRRGVPFKDVVAAALRRGLEREAGARKATPQVLPTFSMGEFTIDVNKARHLADDLEDEEILGKMGRK